MINFFLLTENHDLPLASYKSEAAEILVFLGSIIMNLSLRIQNSEFFTKTMLFFSSSVFWLAFYFELPAFAIFCGANVKPKKFLPGIRLD